jgi:hypothetical protein
LPRSDLVVSQGFSPSCHRKVNAYYSYEFFVFRKFVTQHDGSNPRSESVRCFELLAGYSYKCFWTSSPSFFSSHLASGNPKIFTVPGPEYGIFRNNHSLERVGRCNLFTIAYAGNITIQKYCAA